MRNLIRRIILDPSTPLFLYPGMFVAVLILLALTT